MIYILKYYLKCKTAYGLSLCFYNLIICSIMSCIIIIDMRTISTDTYTCLYLHLRLHLSFIQYVCIVIFLIKIFIYICKYLSISISTTTSKSINCHIYISLGHRFSTGFDFESKCCAVNHLATKPRSKRIEKLTK